jgi:hypothetical protein
MEAAEPGAGPAPDPGGGFKQPAVASKPNERKLIETFICIFASSFLKLGPEN